MKFNELKNQSTYIKALYGYTDIIWYIQELVKSGVIEYTGSYFKKGITRYGISKKDETRERKDIFKNLPQEEIKIHGWDEKIEYIYNGNVSYILKADSDFYPMSNGKYKHYGIIEDEIKNERSRLGITDEMVEACSKYEKFGYEDNKEFEVFCNKRWFTFNAGDDVCKYKVVLK